MVKVLLSTKRRKSHKEFTNILVLFLLLAILGVSFFMIRTQLNFQNQAAGDKAKAANWEKYDDLVRTGELPEAGRILEVALLYDSADENLRIVHTTVKNGYSPLAAPVDGEEYSLYVLNSTGDRVFTDTFGIPLYRHDSLPPPGSKESPQEVVLNKVSFARTIPWEQSYRTVQIYNPHGEMVASGDLRGVQRFNNHPSFKLKNGKEILDKRHQAKGHISLVDAATTDGQYVDMVFIGEDYTTQNMSQFHTDVDRFTAELLSYDPFSWRASQMRISYVENTTDLGCKQYDTNLGWCDDAKVTAAVNNAGVPYDKIFVIWNTPQYLNSGGDIAVAYNGEWGPGVFMHEWGHSFAGLVDEWMANYAYARKDRNCYEGTPPNPAWAGIVKENEYYRGCNYENWYRASYHSVMNYHEGVDGVKYYNNISQHYINQRIDYYAGPFVGPTPTFVPDTPTRVPTPTSTPRLTATPTPLIPANDTTRPSVSITKPKTNSTVKRGSSIDIRVAASDNVKVAKVEFYINNVLICSDLSSQYNCNWNVPNISKVSYTVRATAYDTSGNTNSASISVRSN